MPWEVTPKGSISFQKWHATPFSRAGSFSAQSACAYAQRVRNRQPDGGSSGLGYLINIARQEYDTELIFTVILFIIISVCLADRLIFQPIEHATARQYGGEPAR